MTSFATIKSIFQNPSLLEKALTHRSYLNENQRVEESNERLEYLGDAILEYVVSENLYRRFPKQNEGYLTALRANLVNTKSLYGIAKKLDLGPELLLSKGEEESGGRTNRSILANTVEALIGAIFMDQGLEAATEFINENFLAEIDERLSHPLKDAKSRLQEKVQAEGLPSPKYKVTKEEGPDHDKTFEVQVSVENKILGIGEGRSKSEAEQEAAAKGLVKIASQS